MIGSALSKIANLKPKRKKSNLCCTQMNLCVKKTSSHVAMEIVSREVSFVTMRRTVMMAQMKMLVVSYLFDHYSAIQIQPKKKTSGV